MKNVGFDVDAVLRLAHRIDFRFVEILTVRDHLNVVIAGELGVHQRFQLIHESRRI